MLSHEPHPVPEGVLNVHGHIHGGKLNSINHLNISAWCVGYKPIREDEICRIAANLGKTNYSFLQEWFADKYVFTVDRDDVVTFEGGLVDLEKTRELRVLKFAKTTEV